jgi:hypothetical protein
MAVMNRMTIAARARTARRQSDETRRRVRTAEKAGYPRQHRVLSRPGRRRLAPWAATWQGGHPSQRLRMRSTGRLLSPLEAKVAPKADTCRSLCRMSARCVGLEA